ncbi:MAG: Ycf66 family protein [Leptolyngbya sp.]|nr:Ycf66 family protein [Leptolyngbya sp.]
MEIALHLLSIIVGAGSASLYLAAFFFPEVHRRHDFFWSGVGCFYALILWLDAGQISPTELVGHVASISLMGWLGWQTLTLRRKRTPMPLQTPYTADSWPAFRREMTALGLDALRQTPLRRWLPPPPAEATAPKPGIRMSGLKAVGYEFVDSVEPPEPAIGPKRSVAAEVVGASLTPPKPSPTVLNQPPSPKAEPPRPPQARPTADPKAMPWGQRALGLMAWVQDVARARTTPKPKKTVIEIPPRPSSLAKRSPPSPASPARPVPSPPLESPPVASPPVADAMTPSVDPVPRQFPDLPHPADPGETSNWEDDEEDWIS